MGEVKRTPPIGDSPLTGLRAAFPGERGKPGSDKVPNSL